MSVVLITIDGQVYEVSERIGRMVLFLVSSCERISAIPVGHVEFNFAEGQVKPTIVESLPRL